MSNLDRIGPRPFGRWEVVIMRCLFAFLIYWETMPSEKSRFDEQPKPNGIAHFFDLTFLADPGIYATLEWIAIGCCLLYAIGLVLWVVTPCLAMFSIATWTLANSQGGIGHTYQMVSLILLAQAVVAVAVGIRSWSKERRILWFPDERMDTYLAYFAQVAIVACYVTSGLSKVKNSDGRWLWNSPYFATAIVKTEHQSYYSRLDEPLDEAAIDRSHWLIEHPMAARALFAPGLIFELAAFFALFSRRWALAFGFALVGMHEIIEFIMSLHFAFFQYCVAIWLINPGYWLVSQFVDRKSTKVDDAKRGCRSRILSVSE